ncbi:MAG: FAD:protein FMN transferase [Halioglobus sp.]
MVRIEHQFVAMGGPCCIRLDSANAELAQVALQCAQREVQRLEQKFSRYLPDSITSTINRQAGTRQPVVIDPETKGLLQYADTLWHRSEGMFDLTSGILRKAWNFKSTRLPEQAELNKLLALVGWDKVIHDGESVYLPEPGMELDFGGYVKEYACDAAAGILKRHGISSALVDLGGDMATTGNQADGTPWVVGIRHPETPGQAIAQVSVGAGGLATSGDYERAMLIADKRYGHILNPKTGWPVEGLVAISLLAEQCLVAGSAATIAMLKPQAQALTWLKELGLPWLAVDQNGQCYGTIAQTQD